MTKFAKAKTSHNHKTSAKQIEMLNVAQCNARFGQKALDNCKVI